MASLHFLSFCSFLGFLVTTLWRRVFSSALDKRWNGCHRFAIHFGIFVGWLFKSVVRVFGYKRWHRSTQCAWTKAALPVWVVACGVVAFNLLKNCGFKLTIRPTFLARLFLFLIPRALARIPACGRGWRRHYFLFHCWLPSQNISAGPGCVASPTRIPEKPLRRRSFVFRVKLLRGIHVVLFFHLTIKACWGLFGSSQITRTLRLSWWFRLFGRPLPLSHGSDWPFSANTATSSCSKYSWNMIRANSFNMKGDSSCWMSPKSRHRYGKLSCFENLGFFLSFGGPLSTN